MPDGITFQTMNPSDQPAAASGTFAIGGDLPVHRLGFGAMRITGPGVWGPPADHAGALAVLRRAVELGITLIDTADSYGPFVSEELIAEALHPYPESLIIATKAGLQRPGPDEWEPDARPSHLRERCEGSLRRLKARPHRSFPAPPHRHQGAARRPDRHARRPPEAKAKSGTSACPEVNIDEIQAVQEITPIATVQNLYNLSDRHSEAVLDFCTKENIGFIPWFPLARGGLAGEDKRHRPCRRSPSTHRPGQVALAWLLKKSPVILPIPGTSSVSHLESNTAAALLNLSDDLMRELDSIAKE